VLDKWALEEMRLFLYCQRMRFWFSTVVALVVAGVVNVIRSAGVAPNKTGR